MTRGSDATGGRTAQSSRRSPIERWLRAVVHGVLGACVLLLASVSTALDAARYAHDPFAVVLVGLWGGGLALLLSSVLVVRRAPNRLRPVALVGLGTALGWGATAFASVAAALVPRWSPAGTDGAVGSWLLLLAAAAPPTLVFLWDLRETGRTTPDP